MAEKLTDSLVQGLKPEIGRSRIYYDSRLQGFGIRVTGAGSKSFVLNYRTQNGRERRLTIGSYPTWKTAAARQEAMQLRRDIDVGIDPLDERDRQRNQLRISELCEEFLEYVAPPRLRISTYTSYKNMIAQEILPALGSRLVPDITHDDIAKLHRSITRRGRTYHANRAVALLSRMFNLAIRWQVCSENPADGIEKNHEIKRNRYLSADELQRLGAALDTFPDQQAAAIVRLLLLTGARKGEVLAARWEQFDLEFGTWTKPGAMTKQKTEHRVPLSGAANHLMRELQASAPVDAEWVFPGRHDGHREDIKAAWPKICAGAGLVKTTKDHRGNYVEKHDVRVHDLRHTYASLLASAGQSLPVIGALLGHTQAATTSRYAHLLDDPLRAATEGVGVLLSNSDKAPTNQRTSDGT